MNKSRLEKGEIAFLGLMLLLSLVILYLSSQLFLKDTSLSSEGAFPLLVSLVMMLTMLMSMWEIRHRQPGYDKGLSWGMMALEQLKMLLPGGTALIVLYVLIYAIILKTVGFVIATYVFLVLSMITLNQKNPLKSVLVSALVLAAIMLIFQFLFKVRLP